MTNACQHCPQKMKDSLQSPPSRQNSTTIPSQKQHRSSGFFVTHHKNWMVQNVCAQVEQEHAKKPAHTE